MAAAAVAAWNTKLVFDLATRPGDYARLAAEAWDHTYTAMIADTSHTVTTARLAAGDGHAAPAAAQTALRAGSSGDQPLLDCATACRTLGLATQSRSYIQKIPSACDADVEEDLPPATYQVLIGGWVAS